MADLTTHAILEHNFLFQGLAPATIDVLSELAHRRSYSSGELIFHQGDAADALYGIASGQVRIYTSDDKGHDIFLNILGPGDAFGEIALLDGLPRTASAVTTCETTMVVLPRGAFMAHAQRDTGLSMHLMQLLCQRLRWQSGLIEELALLAGPARVAKRLTTLIAAYGRPAPGGGSEIAMSQADLGRFLGVSRQITNQHLRSWCDQGWVELKRGRIIVRDIEALETIAAQND